MSVNEETMVRVLMRDRVRHIAYIRAIVNDVHIAEDILQDISILALKNREQIEDETHLVRWFRRAAYHRSLNVLRDQKRRPIVMDEQLIELMETHWRDAEKSDTQNMAEALESCLETLAPNSRRLIELRYTRGLSGKNIAQEMDKQINTVYVALSRIYRALSECISKRLKSGEASHE